jgi:hypothetical protein
MGGEGHWRRSGTSSDQDVRPLDLVGRGMTMISAASSSARRRSGAKGSSGSGTT